VQKARLAGTVWIFEANATITDDWIVDLINDSDFVSRVVGGPNNNDTTIFFDLDLEILLLDRELTDQTFYKPLSYIFETPPVDFAENLRAAQNWLPYIGSVNLEAENPPFVRKTGSTINLAGGRSVWGSMGGLVQGETLDLFTREQSLSLGLPERLTGSTPVTRLQRASSDSLIIL